MVKRIVITFMSGAEDGREITLSIPVISIGREESNDVVVPYDSRVSRRHTTLELSKNKLCIRDNGSRNGTYLEDGTTVTNTPALIDSGTLFRLGRTWLKAELVD